MTNEHAKAMRAEAKIMSHIVGNELMKKVDEASKELTVDVLNHLGKTLQDFDNEPEAIMKWLQDEQGYHFGMLRQSPDAGEIEVLLLVTYENDSKFYGGRGVSLDLNEMSITVGEIEMDDESFKEYQSRIEDTRKEEAEQKETVDKLEEKLDELFELLGGKKRTKKE